VEAHRNIVAAYGLSLFGIVAVTALAFFISQRQIDAAGWVAHTERAIARLESIGSNLVAAESAGRAFLLTGGGELPAHFSELLRSATEELDEFAALVLDSPQQQQNVAELRERITARFLVLQENMRAREQRGLQAAVILARSGKGRAGMAAIRQSLNRMAEHEHERLDVRMSSHASMIRVSHTVLLAIVIVGSAVLTLLFRLNMRELSRRLEAEAIASQQARRDPLTGLPNRRSLLERLETAIPSAQRHGHQLALLYVDLDGFKQVNDTLGHTAGDELLRQAAERLKHSTRAEDIVARLGGDEFLIALPLVENAQDVALASARIVQAIARPYAIHGHEARVSASVGVAMYPHDGDNLQQLVAHADTALYTAKANGKGAYHFPAHACEQQAA
jgi:diguanylate cyclase (GGDEF)-like protein